jgi:kynurenine formamidase
MTALSGVTDIQLPKFDDLPMIEKLGLRTSWGVFGDEDRVGTVNLLTDQRTLEAARTITTGETISLTLPLDEPRPPTHHRKPYAHTIFDIDRNNIDDSLDSFYLQGSTQWDALRHVRCREYGFYNGADPASLGVDQWARRGGICGRAVLLDIGRYLESQNIALDHTGGMSFNAELLEATRAHQGVSITEGTVLLIRTGWMKAYLAGDDQRKADLVHSEANPGLEGSEDVARFLWDHGVAALAADNKTIEVAPGNPAVGSLHRRLIPCLGMALGELFDLEVVGDRCDAESRYEFFISSVPLYVPGGVGSPPNAIAIW